MGQQKTNQQDLVESDFCEPNRKKTYEWYRIKRERVGNKKVVRFLSAGDRNRLAFGTLWALYDATNSYGFLPDWDSLAFLLSRQIPEASLRADIEILIASRFIDAHHGDAASYFAGEGATLEIHDFLEHQRKCDLSGADRAALARERKKAAAKEVKLQTEPAPQPQDEPVSPSTLEEPPELPVNENSAAKDAYSTGTAPEKDLDLEKEGKGEGNSPAPTARGQLIPFVSPSADYDPAKDLQALAFELIEDLHGEHPVSCNILTARKAAQDELIAVVSNGTDPVEWCKGLRSKHAEQREIWKIQLAEDPKTYVPPLHTWISGKMYRQKLGKRKSVASAGSTSKAPMAAAAQDHYQEL